MRAVSNHDCTMRTGQVISDELYGRRQAALPPPGRSTTRPALENSRSATSSPTSSEWRNADLGLDRLVGLRAGRAWNGAVAEGNARRGGGARDWWFSAPDRAAPRVTWCVDASDRVGDAAGRQDDA